MSELTVNVSKIIDASIDKVFDAWLDPKMLAAFVLPMPGMATPDVENNPTTGGNFSIVMQVGENKVPHTGTYLTIERHTKLAFTWVSPASLDDSIVTIDFSETSDGKTQVDLSHVKFIDEQHRLNHEGGWGNILSALACIF